MMTSSNGNIDFLATGPLCGEFTSPQWHRALMSSLICIWIKVREINGEAGGLRRHHAHYDVIVMFSAVGINTWADCFHVLSQCRTVLDCFKFSLNLILNMLNCFQIRFLFILKVFRLQKIKNWNICHRAVILQPPIQLCQSFNKLNSFPFKSKFNSSISPVNVDGFMQKRRNSSALAMKLYLFFIKYISKDIDISQSYNIYIYWWQT